MSKQRESTTEDCVILANKITDVIDYYINENNFSDKEAAALISLAIVAAEGIMKHNKKDRDRMMQADVFYEAIVTYPDFASEAPESETLSTNWKPI